MRKLSSNLRELARDEPCSNCGAQDGTVVLAHYSGIYQHRFGKGRGIKGSDWAAAPQCANCHREGPFSEGFRYDGVCEELDHDLGRKILKSDDQLRQIVEWHASLAGRGLL